MAFSTIIIFLLIGNNIVKAMPRSIALAKDIKQKQDSSVPTPMKKRHKSKSHQSKQDNRKKRDRVDKKKQDILKAFIVAAALR